MRNEHIQIGIPCGKNSASYASFLIQTAKLTADHPSDLQFILGVDIGPGKREDVSNVDCWKILKIDTKLPYGSLAHAIVCDNLVKSMDTEYGMILDSDTAFLEKGWDTVMKSALTDKFIIIGTELNHNKSYRNFPSPYGMMFKTEIIKKIGVTFKPIQSEPEKFKDVVTVLKKHGGIADVKILRDGAFFGRKNNDIMACDMSSQIPYTVRKNGYDGLCLKNFWEHDKGTQFLNDGDQGQEYQYNGKVYFTHQGRASRREFDSDPKNRKWVHQVKKWFKSHLKIDLS